MPLQLSILHKPCNTTACPTNNTERHNITPESVTTKTRGTLQTNHIRTRQDLNQKLNRFNMAATRVTVTTYQLVYHATKVKALSHSRQANVTA